MGGAVTVFNTDRPKAFLVLAGMQLLGQSSRRSDGTGDAPTGTQGAAWLARGSRGRSQAEGGGADTTVAQAPAALQCDSAAGGPELGLFCFLFPG